MTAPIFIVGANRSGTTLLRLLLNAHSEIAIPDEINYLYGFDFSVSFENWRTPNLSDAEYRDFVNRFLADNAARVPELDLGAVRADILSKPIDLRAPYKILLERWAAHHGKRRWGEKTPGNIYHSQILMDMFPSAQFIHVARDPRAGVASMKKVSFFPDDAVLNAMNRHKVMTLGRDVFFRSVPDEQRIEIRYEDLVTDPPAILKTVCDFLRIPYEEEMLRFHVDAENFMTENASSTFNSAATRPISTKGLEKWRTDLTSDEIASIEFICGAEMTEFEYDRLNPPLSWSGMFTLAIKWAYARYQWWRHRHDPLFSIVTPMFSRTTTRLRRLKEWGARRLGWLN